MQGNQAIQRGKRTRCVERTRALRGLGTVACLVAILGLAVPPAQAAFPGRNGLIAFNAFTSRGEHVVLSLSPKRRLGTLIPRSRGGDEVREFEFSPGGRLLAITYQGGEGASGDQDIWIKPASRRGRPRRMIPKPPGTNFHGSGALMQFDDEPDWSPGGRSLVFTRTTIDNESGGQTRQEIRIYHRGHSRPLIANGGDPTWSVRNEIAFVRLEGDPAQTQTPVIYSVRPDGTGLRRITRGDQPDWAPDGRRLAFMREGHLATISRTGRRRQVTRHRRCVDSEPAFSPGGSQLAFKREDAFLSGRGCPTRGPNAKDHPLDTTRTALVAVRTDGTHLRRLVRRSIFDPVNVDWQPLRRRR